MRQALFLIFNSLNVAKESTKNLIFFLGYIKSRKPLYGKYR